MTRCDPWRPGPPPGRGQWWIYWHYLDGTWHVDACEVSPAAIRYHDPDARLLLKMPHGVAYPFDSAKEQITHHAPMGPPEPPGSTLAPSDPWIPIEECGELERGWYLVQLRSGAQIVALWSGDSEGWVLRQRDLDEFDSPRDITHVHQMGPIRGPEETT